MITSELVKEWAAKAGLDACGVARAQAVSESVADYYRRWLERGRHGRMTYLARNTDKRLDVRLLVPGAQSVICAALGYYDRDEAGAQDKPQEQGTFQIARYAWRGDYHKELKKRLDALRERMEKALGRQFVSRVFVDSAPVLEKYWARQAGLGWIGKNGLLVTQAWGSWVVLGELVCDLELEPDKPAADGCGMCERCLHACPTGALAAARQLEARRCLSYVTIEGGQDDLGILKSCGAWGLGCDACQEVCPYNQKVQAQATADWRVHPNWRMLTQEELLQMDEAALRRRFAGSTLERVDWTRWREQIMR